MTTILRTEELTKRFGALAAVNRLTCEVEEGEVFGIAGPNGAGKTTLFDVVSGHARASDGRVYFKGQEIQTSPAHEICHMGMARTYQVAPLLTTQTALGNILLAAYFGRKHRAFSGLKCDDHSVQLARQEAAFVGLPEERLAQPSHLLSAYDRKRLMFACALATQPDLLLLDEPASGLSEAECEHLVALVREVKARGVTIMLVEHVMRVLMAVSDRVMMMHQGSSIFTGTCEEAQVDSSVVQLYLGDLACEAPTVQEVSGGPP